MRSYRRVKTFRPGKVVALAGCATLLAFVLVFLLPVSSTILGEGAFIGISHAAQVQPPPPPPPGPFAVPVDIKPPSCPNPINVRGGGDFMVAILGFDTFDVRSIDPASIRLSDVNGIDFASPVPPFRSSLNDVATPFEPFTGKAFDLDCNGDGPDGLLDLALRFDKQLVLREIEDTLNRALQDREVLVISLTGNLKNGTEIFGEDVIVIITR